MFTTNEPTLYHQASTGPYRAIVTYTNQNTGEIRVKIPSVFSNSSEATISYIGRTKYNSVWPVPDVGSQIVVAADDESLTNLFWVQVNPDQPTSLTQIQSEVDTNASNISTNASNITALTERVQSLENYKDALLLGVFN
jgi:hypothetical protein